MGLRTCPRPTPRPWFGLAALVLLAGCTVEPSASEEPARPPLIPTRGVVTLDGRPLAGAVVVFLPVSSESGFHCTGETAADGTYELSTLDRVGAAPGDYRVAVSYQVGANGKVVDRSAREADVAPPEFQTAKELLPPRYSDLSRTELRASIAGDGSDFDFELQGPLLPPPGLADDPEMVP